MIFPVEGDGFRIVAEGEAILVTAQIVNLVGQAGELTLLRI